MVRRPAVGHRGRVYKIYAESFRGPEHLAQVQAEAREVVGAALGNDERTPAPTFRHRRNLPRGKVGASLPAPGAVVQRASQAFAA